MGRFSRSSETQNGGRPWPGATHEAYSATRVMGTGIATGQAAGTAAALALKQKKTTRQLRVAELQEALRSQGVVI